MTVVSAHRNGPMVHQYWTFSFKLVKIFKADQTNFD
jgi:hypothetical protein